MVQVTSEANLQLTETFSQFRLHGSRVLRVGENAEDVIVREKVKAREDESLGL